MARNFLLLFGLGKRIVEGTFSQLTSHKSQPHIVIQREFNYWEELINNMVIAYKGSLVTGDFRIREKKNWVGLNLLVWIGEMLSPLSYFPSNK